MSEIEVSSVDSRRYCCIKIGSGIINQHGYSEAITTAVKSAECMGNNINDVMAALIIGSPETIIIDMGAEKQAGRVLAMSVVSGLIQEYVDFSVKWKVEIVEDEEDKTMAGNKAAETPE